MTKCVRAAPPLLPIVGDIGSLDAHTQKPHLEGKASGPSMAPMLFLSLLLLLREQTGVSGGFFLPAKAASLLLLRLSLQGKGLLRFGPDPGSAHLLPDLSLHALWVGGILLCLCFDLRTE